MSDSVKFSIEGKTYSLEVDSLTFGEVELIEDATGKAFGELDFESAKSLMALAWVARRRVEPLCTLDDMRALPVSSVQPVDEPDPTTAGEPGDKADGDSGSPSSQ